MINFGSEITGKITNGWKREELRQGGQNQVQR